MNEPKKYSPVGSLILAAVSMIWGFSFAIQKTASRALPPFSVNTVRFFIGAAALYLITLARDAFRKGRDRDYRPAPFSRTDSTSFKNLSISSATPFPMMFLIWG